MGAQGTTTIDFGAFPGKSDASVDVTGQASIVSGSLVEAWLRLTDSIDHLADEHFLETMHVSAGNIIAGTGFTIYARNNSEIFEPLEPIKGKTTVIAGALSEPGGDQQRQTAGGIGTRLYGTWNVNWVWN
jgi:hypothetical protein